MSFDFTWNPPDFMKSAGFHEIRMKSGGFHEIRMKSGGFHEIHPNLIKSEEFLLKHQKSFCSNIWFYKVWGGFYLKSAGFHGEIRRISWNPPDFTDFMKSAGFHGEIRRISWWNPPDFTDFMKSARISWWNPPDFMNVSFWVMIKYRSFYRKTNQITQQKLFSFMECSGKAVSGFHEIRRISCEIRRISKDQQLPGMVRPMFNFLSVCFISEFMFVRTFQKLRIEVGKLIILIMRTQTRSHFVTYASKG